MRSRLAVLLPDVVDLTNRCPRLRSQTHWSRFVQLTSLCSSSLSVCITSLLSFWVIFLVLAVTLFVSPVASSSAAALLLSCSRCCVGHVPHGQWALLDTGKLALIDRSVCLVEPRTCDRRIECSRASRSAHGFRRKDPIVESLRRAVFTPKFAPGNLGPLLDDLFVSLGRLLTPRNLLDDWCFFCD